MTNRYIEHVVVLPEDDRNRQIVNGFLQNGHVVDARIKLERPAGGWSAVFERFETDYIAYLSRYSRAFVVLIVDFDDTFEHRMSLFEDGVPKGLRDRVFVIGCKSTPEALKQSLNRGYESIGSDLADECYHGRYFQWQHEQLAHNEPVRLRMESLLRPILLKLP